MAKEPVVTSTMMDDFPLTVQMIFRHGRDVFGDSEVITATGEGARRATFTEVAERADELASVLHELGVTEGDRVGTFMWNNQEHMEAYFAIPCMGAVLHTLNLRLFPEQLVYVANHAEDKVIIADDTVIPLLARVADQLKTVEHILVVGSGDTSGLEPTGAKIHRYEELLDAQKPGFRWPELSERSAAGLCYTTGTTGNPKGVAYSQRSITLHTFGTGNLTVAPIGPTDRVLVVVPQFHAMAWGLPYGAWMVGSDILMPEKFLQAEPLARLIEAERPTSAAGIPTVFNELAQYAEQHGKDLSSFRFVTCGGSAVPEALIQKFEDQFGVPVVQGWGMTETSPVAAMSWPPRGVTLNAPDPSKPEQGVSPASMPPLGGSGREAIQWRAKTGRAIPGVEFRIVSEDGGELPWDGRSVGEIEVRGPWVTAGYFRTEDPDKFDDGWLRTGDVGSIDRYGFIQITDRAKDVIKSGGEWISSVELENQLMGHPDVAEAAVVGVPDDKWQERPLACVVPKQGNRVEPDRLRDFLSDKVAKWWIPERWTFVEGIPKTSVGKFDKKVLRTRYGEGQLDVETL